MIFDIIFFINILIISKIIIFDILYPLNIENVENHDILHSNNTDKNNIENRDILYYYLKTINIENYNILYIFVIFNFKYRK